MVNLENYHTETDHISKSGLDLINKSPAHYYYKYLDEKKIEIPKKKNTWSLIGDIFHCLLMEPQFFFSRYMVMKSGIDGRTTKGKELKFKYQVAAKGKTLVTDSEYKIAMSMRAATLRHPIAQKLFAKGDAEQIFTFTEPETGVQCKIRPDWITPTDIIVDLKSANDASCFIELDDDDNPSTPFDFNGFTKSIKNFRYDIQDSFYFDGYGHATGKKAREFIFVAVEKEPPFEVCLYYLDETIRSAAKEKYLTNLETYRQCKESGIWIGYSSKVVRVNSI